MLHCCVTLSWVFICIIVELVSTFNLSFFLGGGGVDVNEDHCLKYSSAVFEYISSSLF